MASMDRKAYFDAATEILADSGFQALTIGRLCESLHVTSGSFYHHFAGWDDFRDRYMKDWEQQQTNRIIEIVLTHEAPAEQLRVLIELAAAIPHAAEAAIRAWSVDDEAVAAVQRRVDRERLDFSRELIGRLVNERARAHVLAQLLVAAYVGLEVLNPQGFSQDFGGVLDALRELILSEVS
jgi:AcrR family transcriptional regulator